jgi:hypothetical protein
MRGALAAAGGLVIGIGLPLFVLPGYTDAYFAFAIDPPATAALLGANYLASSVLAIGAARARTWREACAAVPGAWVFTVLTLAFTVASVARGEFEVWTVPGVVWLLVYAVFPFLLGWVWWGQWRAARRVERGGEPSARADTEVAEGSTEGTEDGAREFQIGDIGDLKFQTRRQESSQGATIRRSSSTEKRGEGDGNPEFEVSDFECGRDVREPPPGAQAAARGTSIRLSPVLRWVLGAIGAGLLAVGLGMLVWPEEAGWVWLWDLSPANTYAGRAGMERYVSAWLIGMGMVAAQLCWENDRAAARPALRAGAVLVVLQAVVVGRAWMGA